LGEKRAPESGSAGVAWTDRHSNWF